MEIIQFGRKSVDFLGHLMLVSIKFQSLWFFLGFFQDKELLAKAKLEFKHVWPGVVVDEQHTAPTSSTRQTSLHVSVPAGARRLPETPVGKLPRLKMTT